MNTCLWNSCGLGRSEEKTPWNTSCVMEYCRADYLPIDVSLHPLSARIPN